MGESKRKSSGGTNIEDVADESGIRTWSDLWTDYCDHSTMPGIRQVGQDTPFVMRT